MSARKDLKLLAKPALLKAGASVRNAGRNGWMWTFDAPVVAIVPTESQESIPAATESVPQPPQATLYAWRGIEGLEGPVELEREWARFEGMIDLLRNDALTEQFDRVRHILHSGGHDD